MGIVRYHFAGDEEVMGNATVLRISIIGDEDSMPSPVKSFRADVMAAITMASSVNVRLDDRTPEERRALRRLRNDKRGRSWTRSDNKRVEAAMANRY